MISKKAATKTVFYVIKKETKKNASLEPPSLFDFGKFYAKTKNDTTDLFQLNNIDQELKRLQGEIINKSNFPAFSTIGASSISRASLMAPGKNEAI